MGRKNGVELAKNLDDMLTVKTEQEIQNEGEKIDRTTFSENYKRSKKNIDKEDYREDKQFSGIDKEYCVGSNHERC